MKKSAIIAFAAAVAFSACDKGDGEKPNTEATSKPAENEAPETSKEPAKEAAGAAAANVAEVKLTGDTKWMVRYAGPISGEVSGANVNASGSVNNYQVRGRHHLDNKKNESGKNGFSAMIFLRDDKVKDGTMMVELPDGTRCLPPKDDKVEKSQVEVISVEMPTKMHAKMQGHMQCGEHRVAYKAEFVDDRG